MLKWRNKLFRICIFCILCILVYSTITHIKIVLKVWQKPVMKYLNRLHYNYLNYHYYWHYHVHPDEIHPHPKKLILLWTPIMRNYKGWAWAIGPAPIIRDCENLHIDGKCLITTNADLLVKADVVLFSIEDIELVCWKYYIIIYMYSFRTIFLFYLTTSVNGFLF